MDITKLTDLELSDAVKNAKEDSSEMDALMAEFHRRHKEKMSKIPLEERKRRSYERFVLHADDVEWTKTPKKSRFSK